MRSTFGQNARMAVRAIATVSVIVLAAFAIGLPMGCGDVNTATKPTGTSSSSSAKSLDQIPVSEISFEGNANPSTWKPIGTIDKMEIKNPSSYAPTICWTWDQPANWPYKDGKSLGNNWIIFKIKGAWHATPWEHLPKGHHVCRTTEALRGEPPFIQGFPPISSYHPEIGEEVGFMNTTIARGSQGGYNNPKERTYVYLTKWQGSDTIQ